MSIEWRTTAAGRAAIATAIGVGPRIQVPTFKVGTSVNYTPTTTETALHGSILYTGTVQDVQVINVNKVKITVVLGQTVGDFSFGEVGVYLDNGDLFAIGSLPSLQAKRATTPSQVGDIVKLEIIINETNVGGAIDFVLTTLTNARMLAYTGVDTLLPPVLSGSNAYITESVAYGGEQILALRSSDYFWSFPDYHRVFDGTTTALGTTTSLTCSALGASDLVNVQPGKYILAITSGTYSGYCRLVTVKAGSDITWATAFPVAIANGVTFTVWESFHGYTNNHSLDANPHPQYSVSSASTAVAGKVELATDAEAQLLGDGSAALVLTPSTLAGAFGGSNQSTGDFGWQRLPGNLIMLWGYETNPDAGNTISQNIYWPLELSSLLNVQVQGLRIADTGWVPAVPVVTVRSTSGATVVFDTANSGVNFNSGMPYHWFAIGMRNPWTSIPAGSISLDVPSYTHTFPVSVAVAATTISTESPASTGSLRLVRASGALPDGMTLTVSGLNIQLSGTPTVDALFNSTWWVINQTIGQRTLLTLAITISP